MEVITGEGKDNAKIRAERRVKMTPKTRRLALGGKVRGLHARRHLIIPTATSTQTCFAVLGGLVAQH